MRLICPNCDAQYEVPEDVMPPEGRDVQCSNCGQTWFQDHPDALVAREASWSQDDFEDEEIIRADDSDMSEPEPFSEPEPDPVADVPTFEPEPSATQTEPAPSPRRPRDLDPAVADVLRQEAELEQTARRNEAASMESQPDLGLTEDSDESARRAREARDRMARMRGEPPAKESAPSDASAAAATLGSRRDLLPDIEEINSTLRSNSARSPGTDPGQTAQIEVREKRSSRRGFILTIALIAVLALLYTYAPQLSGAAPALEPLLAGYVAMIDGWRVWLDTQISSLLTWLDAAATTSAEQ